MKRFYNLKNYSKEMDKNQIMRNQYGDNISLKKFHELTGYIKASRDGLGFLVLDNGEDHLVINKNQMKLLFDGDRIIVKGFLPERKFQDKIQRDLNITVLSRAHKKIIGRYFEEEKVGFVIPDNPKIRKEILVSKGYQYGAKVGDFVEIKITHWPTLRFQAQGEILKVIGNHQTPGIETQVTLEKNSVRDVWSKSIVEEIKRIIPDTIEKSTTRRINLCHLPFITIDDETANDFDDAVFCECIKKDNDSSLPHWKLYVAIADVSHYVKDNSAIDSEARLRGNSIYFPDYVVPMLPEEISNNLCSLLPKVNRLALVCEMNVSGIGGIESYRFYEATIHSHHRLTYTMVNDILSYKKNSSTSRELMDNFPSLIKNIKLLHSLYKSLFSARELRGAIDFNSKESHIIFGEDRKIREIHTTIRGKAHRIIEECMLCANFSAADFLVKNKVPTLYRVHNPPSSDKVGRLDELLKTLDLTLSPGNKNATPKDYSKLLLEIRKHKDAKLIESVVLRSLEQAVYSTKNQGHFGLNYDSYTHFTSPIRRYSDLLVHRAIRSLINFELRQPIYSYTECELENLSLHLSSSERKADKITREVTHWLKCIFIKDHIGDAFSGVISSVTNFGLFVEIPALSIEGLVHVTSLTNEYYHFDSIHHCLKGDLTGRCFTLGDSLEVLIMSVNLDEKRILLKINEDKRNFQEINNNMRLGITKKLCEIKKNIARFSKKKLSSIPVSKKNNEEGIYFIDDARKRNSIIRQTKETNNRKRSKLKCKTNDWN